MTLIQQLIGRITIRLSEYEMLAKQGVIPGQLDTYELEQLIGRIKELKLILTELSNAKLD